MSYTNAIPVGKYAAPGNDNWTNPDNEFPYTLAGGGRTIRPLAIFDSSQKSFSLFLAVEEPYDCSQFRQLLWRSAISVRKYAAPGSDV